MDAQLTLVLGGIASGKSAFAESLARATGLPPVYLATAEAKDGEMQARIARHQNARGPGWQVIEEPLAVDERLRALPSGHVVLLDCATMWLSNHLLAGSGMAGDLAAAQVALIGALTACASPVIVVSNEVGLSGVPGNALARRFGEAQGRLNQALAAAAERVVLVTAGLPLTLKGPAR